MTNLAMEMALRYVVSGLIMYAALFAGLFVRLLMLMFRDNGTSSDAIIRGRRMNCFLDSQCQAPKWERVLRYVVWPYGIIKILDGYLKIEPRLIEAMMNGSF